MIVNTLRNIGGLFHVLAKIGSDIFLLPEDPFVLGENVRDLTKSYQKQLDTLCLGSVVVLANYGDRERAFLRGVKYERASIGSNFVSRDLVDVISDAYDVIVYPPVSFWSFFSRGGNHVLKLFSGFLKTQEKPIWCFLAPFKQQQAKKWKHMRLKRQSFILKKRYRSRIIGKRVLLIDDVISTGSTANQLAKILRDAGAKTVHGVFLFSSQT